jgi:hypothetical protein
MLHVYNWAGKNNNLWMNRLWKKIGDEPVIFDSTLVDRTNKEFEKLFINMGYMNVEVNSTVKKQNKKANVTYTIKGNTPFLIRNYTTVIEDDSIGEILKNIPSEPLLRTGGESSLMRMPLIKSGMLFDRNLLNAERERISALLRNRGYYTFAKENIDYEAMIDTSSNSKYVDLTMKIHLMPEILPNGNYIEALHKKYHYDKVNIYLDYDPLEMTGINNYHKADSAESQGYTIFYSGENHPSGQALS